jgi:lysozyme family protein
VDAILKRLIAREGGYVDNPYDAGGCTNYGITRVGWHGVMGTPITCDQLKTLPMMGAMSFYRKWGQQYGIWNFLEIDVVLTEILMDTSVLFGAGRVIKWVQLEGGIEDDGIVGPDTLTVAHQNPRNIAKSILRRRLHSHAYRVSRDTSQARFLVGWVDRCTALMNLL